MLEALQPRCVSACNHLRVRSSQDEWGDELGDGDDDMDEGSEGDYSDSGSGLAGAHMGAHFHGPPGSRHERFY